MAKPSSRIRTSQSGCGFLLLTGISILILLVVNVWIVKTLGRPLFYGWDNRFFQAAQFVLPIILIFFEFWIYDRFWVKK